MRNCALLTYTVMYSSFAAYFNGLAFLLFILKMLSTLHMGNESNL
jgi:hypothetical protein